jgi:DNA polymerase-3 subunit gamma/tau
LLYSICLHGRSELGLAPDEYAALTMVLLRLLAFKPTGGSARAEKKTLKKAQLQTDGLTVPPSQHSEPALIAPAQKPLRPTAALSVAPPDHTAAAATQAAVISLAAPQAAAPVFQPNQALAQVDKAPVAPENIANETIPAGQHLPVVAMSGHSAVPVSNQPVAQTEYVQEATKIEAFQVRVQADSAREAVAAGMPHAVQPSAEGDFWHATVQSLIAVEAINAMVRELALQSQLVARDTDQWLLRVERESLNQSGSRDRLAAALAAAGYPVRLVAEVGRVSDSPAKRNAAAAAERQLAAEKIIFDDPFVQSMMREFGAKIVPGSIKPIQLP